MYISKGKLEECLCLYLSVCLSGDCSLLACSLARTDWKNVSMSLSVYLCLCLYVFVYLCLSLSLSVSVSLFLSVAHCLCLCLSVSDCLSVCLAVPSLHNKAHQINTDRPDWIEFTMYLLACHVSVMVGYASRSVWLRPLGRI